MTFQEPKVEFVSIDVNMVTTTSACSNGKKEASIEICGCTDSAVESTLSCPDGIV